MKQRSPVNDVLNNSKTKRGVDYRIVLAALIASVFVFLFGSHMLSFAMLPCLLLGGYFISKDDPNKIDLYWLSRKQFSCYQPRPGAPIK